jgi:hypothetical protein
MRRWLRVQGDSSKILELVKAYSVPIRDDRISKLITWYVNALQKAIDMTGIILGGNIASQRSLGEVEG